jgi:glycosyltransferase involved in cell wall biosynthesis
MPSISYAITACTEVEELKRLFDKLLVSIREEDEIILQVGQDKGTTEIQDVFIESSKSFENRHSNMFITFSALNNDFATFKNDLKLLCKKDYIFFIDADEYPSENLLHHLPLILESNPVDLLIVPRVNTVEGLTPAHIQKWGWRVDEEQRINWPDYQTRIVRNHRDLKWEGKVHERIVGSKSVSHFPFDNADWALYHPKTIQKQEQQNNFYDTL